MKTVSRFLLVFALITAMLMGTVCAASAAERLIVSAVSEDAIAGPGNRLPNYTVVSVTAVDGTPVTGLAMANFKIDAMVVGPGGSLVNITSVNPGRLPGFYTIQTVPIGTYTWKAGTYIFAVSVTQGIRHGQALAKVKMD